MSLEKRRKSLEQNFGKDVVELTVPYRKYLVFVAMYTERCVQRDLHKGKSQIRLKNMISSLQGIKVLS